jgi:hypothetical protein
MTRDRDQQPRRAASADDAFLEVTGARAKGAAPRTKTSPEEVNATDAGRPRPSAAETRQDADGTGETDESEAEHATGATAAFPSTTSRTTPDDEDQGTQPDDSVSPEEVRDRLRRRAIFLRELAEARELRQRVTPHRSRRARIHAALRRRTFRLH